MSLNRRQPKATPSRLEYVLDVGHRLAMLTADVAAPKRARHSDGKVVDKDSAGPSGSEPAADSTGGETVVSLADRIQLATTEADELLRAEQTQPLDRLRAAVTRLFELAREEGVDAAARKRLLRLVRLLLKLEREQDDAATQPPESMDSDSQESDVDDDSADGGDAHSSGDDEAEIEMVVEEEEEQEEEQEM